MCRLGRRWASFMSENLRVLGVAYVSGVFIIEDMGT